MIILGSYSQNNISFRSSRKPENQMKSGLVCKTVYKCWLTRNPKVSIGFELRKVGDRVGESVHKFQYTQ